MFLSSLGEFCSTVRSVSIRVLRGCSSCVFKLSRVLSASAGTSLREPGHGMDGSTIANSRPEVGRWLRKGFKSCGKSAAMTAAGAKNEHGGHNVPGALHGFEANVAGDSGVENRQDSLLSYGSRVQMFVPFVTMLLSILVFGTLMALVWTNMKEQACCCEWW